ncbi:hypothetical protein [Scopulibacillus cellulosilyticus]|uniref:YppG-like protein n=1 Tax=Scopulibacillus cellulosilyticus TaxID=2665665 RepID=A0ABW2PZ47_9BACL
MSQWPMSQGPMSFFKQQSPFYNQQSFPFGQYSPFFNKQTGGFGFGNLPTTFGHVMNGMKILKQLGGMTSFF